MKTESNSKRKKRWIGRPLLFVMILLLILTEGGMGTLAAQTESLPDQHGQAAVAEQKNRYTANDWLNDLRSMLGLRTQKLMDPLNEAAGHHCEYLKSSFVYSLTEVQERDGFTGTTPHQRARYVGYASDVLETGRISSEGYIELMETLLHNPADRTILLHPFYDQIGFGSGENAGDIMIGNSHTGEENPTLIVYPYAGAQSVGNTSLTMLGDVPQEVRAQARRGQIGEVITATLYLSQPSYLTAENLKVVLTDTRREREVPCFVSETEKERSRYHTITIYPLSAYNADTRYEVSLEGSILEDGKEILKLDEVWSFSSSGPDSIGEVSHLEILQGLCQTLRVDTKERNVSNPFRFSDYAYDPQDPDSQMVYCLVQDRVLTEGVTGESLAPDEGATRKEAAVWMMKMVQIYARRLYDSVELSYKDTFRDINKCGADLMKWVQRAHQLEIVNDQGSGMFSPDVYITRTEFDTWMELLKEKFEATYPELIIEEETETE